MNNHSISDGFSVPETPVTRTHQLSPLEAKKLLEEGNMRFRENRPLGKDICPAHRERLAIEGQQPYAVIVGCSDSRVPPELVFDAGLGELFVIRTAGNLLDPIVLGSIEFAVSELKAPLVVILGHEGCGAVEATIQAVEANTGGPSFISAIVEKICPSVTQARAEGCTGSPLVHAVIECNVRACREELITSSPVVAEEVKKGRLAVFGAKYSLAAGSVQFLK